MYLEPMYLEKIVRRTKRNSTIVRHQAITHLNEYLFVLILYYLANGNLNIFHCSTKSGIKSFSLEVSEIFVRTIAAIIRY